MTSTAPVDNSDPFTFAFSPPSVDLSQDTRRPGSRTNDIPGLADQKDTRRLMIIMPRPRGRLT